MIIGEEKIQMMMMIMEEEESKEIKEESRIF